MQRGHEGHGGMSKAAIHDAEIRLVRSQEREIRQMKAILARKLTGERKV